MYYGPYVNQYICTTDHTSASTYALRTIRQPVHMYYGPYVNQYICTTDHTSTSTYVLQTIRQPVHMYYRPYVNQYICTTDPTSTSTYVLQTIRQPVLKTGIKSNRPGYGCNGQPACTCSDLTNHTDVYRVNLQVDEFHV